MAVIGIRSRRRKLAEGMERSLSDLLHERMEGACRRSNPERRPEDNTSAVYTWATNAAPGMLDQLYEVHIEASRERGDINGREVPVPQSDDERKRMLSAVRASVARTRPKFR